MLHLMDRPAQLEVAYAARSRVTTASLLAQALFLGWFVLTWWSDPTWWLAVAGSVAALSTAGMARLSLLQRSPMARLDWEGVSTAPDIWLRRGRRVLWADVTLVQIARGSIRLWTSERDRVSIRIGVAQNRPDDVLEWITAHAIAAKVEGGFPAETTFSGGVAAEPFSIAPALAEDRRRLTYLVGGEAIASIAIIALFFDFTWAVLAFALVLPAAFTSLVLVKIREGTVTIDRRGIWFGHPSARTLIEWERVGRLRPRLLESGRWAIQLIPPSGDPGQLDAVARLIPLQHLRMPLVELLARMRELARPNTFSGPW
jgi:hypothetical protein